MREFAVLPDSITRDGYERPVVISHPALKEAFEQYIQWLLQSGINTQPAAHHLGLDPTAPLLVNDKGVSFSMQSRGEGVLSRSAINKCLDTLIMNAGLADIGIKRISLLRTAVIESYRSGMSTSDLMITTGFSAETIKARLLVLGHARAWMLDQVTGQASSYILLDENEEMQPTVSREAHKYCADLSLKIAKLQSQLKALS